ncbi:GTD2B protein, partial [Polyodon spathula]|nr:GTD2B protein [Polyodon spathula]
NTSLQGKNSIVSQIHSIYTVKALVVKLCLFEKHVKDHNVVHFPSLKAVIDSFPNKSIPESMEKYVSIISALIAEFNKCFKDFSVTDKDTLRRHTKKKMGLFGSTYICEQTFSILNINKTRLRSSLTDAHQTSPRYSSPRFSCTTHFKTL